MLKVIRNILYGLAITTGVAGLFAGGVPLAEYLLEMSRDSEYSHYYDPRSLNEPEIIFLLSVILLIGVRICFALDGRIRPANPPDAGPSEEKPVAPAPANEIPPQSGAAETTARPAESADEKLTRLLDGKKD